MKKLCVAMTALALAGCLWPLAGLASCVYNKAHSPIEVNFSCGSGCENNWTIHPSYHQCRHGKAGTVAVRVMDADDKNELDDGACVVKVGAHGWVTVHQKAKKITVRSKHKDGSVRQECHTWIVKQIK